MDHPDEASIARRAVLVARLRAAGCVYAEDEAELLRSSARGPAELRAMVERRVAGSPLEHVVGWAAFCGRRYRVDAGVFVPRRRSEFLVREAVLLASPGAVVVDLCCGCGAIGGAIASQIERIELHASDVDPAAVRCARRNLAELGGRVHEGDLFAPLPPGLRGRVDLLTVNAPYVPTSEIATLPRDARLHEPHVALDGGADGLELHRRVLADAHGWLATGGHVVCETTGPQAERLVGDAWPRLDTHLVRSDELEATVVVGRRTPPVAHRRAPASSSTRLRR